MRAMVMVCWLCWCMLCAAAQTAVAERGLVFDTGKTALVCEQYKWGNELFVVWQGQCRQEFAGAVVTLELGYAGICIRREQQRLEIVPALSPGEPSRVSIRWGPLNEPHESILAGDYEASLRCTLEQQPAAMRQRLQAWLERPLVHTARLYWQTPEIFAHEERRLRAFYQERLSKQQELTQSFLLRCRSALKAPQDIARKRPNPWLANDAAGARFAENKWRAWLEQEFHLEMQKEIDAIARFHKRLFGRRHPELHGKLEAYLALLLHYSRLATIKIYEKNRLPLHASDTSLVDTFGPENDTALLQDMQRTLQQCYRLLELPSPALDFFKD